MHVKLAAHAQMEFTAFTVNQEALALKHAEHQTIYLFNSIFNFHYRDYRATLFLYFHLILFIFSH